MKNRQMLPAAWAAALLVCAASEVTAQQQGVVVGIAPHAELRVTTASPSSTRLKGRFLGLQNDTLTMTGNGGRAAIALPVSTLRQVQVRGSQDRGRGALIGAGILGGIAVVFGGIDASKGDMSGGELAGSIVTNSLIGGLLGAALAPRGWVTVPGIGSGR